LRMFVYRPPTLADNPALVVVLHDAPKPQRESMLGRDGRPTRTATVLPASARSNSRPTQSNGCFTGFSPSTVGATRANPLSIRQDDRKIYRRQLYRSAFRIFVTGLSAEARMTSNMLAFYPGSICRRRHRCPVLPYCAQRMSSKRSKRVFKSLPSGTGNGGISCAKPRHTEGRGHATRIWQGKRRKTVIPSNALGESKSSGRGPWSFLCSPSSESPVLTAFHVRFWINEAGYELIEKYTITTCAWQRVGDREAEGACGAPGPFLAARWEFLIVSHCKIFRDCGCRRP
jgi:hypothetical protein